MKAPVLVVVSLAVSLVGCKKDDPEPSGAILDASYDAPSDRHVVQDVPDGFFAPRDTTDVTSVMTGTPGVGGGGDAAGGPMDGPRPPDAGMRDVGGESAAGSCDLYQQNCGDSQGCYLSADGRSVCRLAGGFPEAFDCNQHEDCMPGYLCAPGFTGSGTLCLRICDPRTGNTCPGMRGCRSYPGTQVGTCAP